MHRPKLLLLVVASFVLLYLVLSLVQTETHHSHRFRVQPRYRAPQLVREKLADEDEPRYGVPQFKRESSAERDQGAVDTDIAPTWEDTQADRVGILRQQCQQLKKQGYEFHDMKKSQLGHIIVNDEYRVMYCYVPKIACTNMKRIFLLLTDKMNTTDPLKLSAGDVHSSLDDYLTYLNSYSIKDIQYRIQNYRKVMFVREPMERILSAFRNKFVQHGNQYFKERFGRLIVKRFRENASEASLMNGDDVTFPEFVKYLLHPRTREQGLNEHWAPITDLCLPCHLSYDFVGKYESIDDDVDKLLQQLSVDDWIQFPKRGDTYKTLKTEDMLGKFYRNLTSSQFRELQKLYSEDLQLFPYDTPERLVKLFYSD